MGFWERADEGELTIDHRNSPGLPAWFAERQGLDPKQLGEGGVFSTFTKGCTHCGGVVVMNPNRTRPRNHCFRCDHYICDGCAAVAALPDYVHRSFKELVDLVKDGKVILTGGGTASDPHIQKVK